MKPTLNSVNTNTVHQGQRLLGSKKSLFKNVLHSEHVYIITAPGITNPLVTND